MNKLGLIWKFEALGFLRSRLFQVAFGLMAAIGIYALFYGKAEIDRQREVLSEIRRDEAAKMQTLQSGITGDTLPNVIGNRTYRLVDNPPSDWASLALGSRDIFPYYLYVRYWSLSRQLLTAEMANPEKLLIGNLDLAFVLIYLFPLFIIAISYNLMSAEREAGTLPLLLSNPISERQISYYKIAFRWLITFGMAFLLVILGLVICSIPPGPQLFWWLMATALYITFWYGVVLVVSNLRRGSSFNSLSLLGAWIVIVVLLPALINLYLASAYASPPRNDLTQAIRHEYEEIWDNYDNKAYRFASMQKLAEQYPTYRSDTSYNWADKFMLAEFEFYDERIAPIFKKYGQLKEDRQSISESLGAFSAAVAAQNYYNSLARTDLDAHSNFLENTNTFHADLKKFFYTKIYSNTPFRKSDFESIPMYRAEEYPDTPADKGMLLLLSINVLVVWGVGLFWKKGKAEF